MSKNQPSAQSAVEGELGLDDLEKIAGGMGDLKLPQVDESILKVTTPDTKQSDNMFGAQGGSQENLHNINNTKPLNMSMCFP